MGETSPQAVQSSYLGGKLQLFQPARGYRAAIDPALLAASLKLKPETLAVEFGCGVGAAMLSAARLNPGVDFLGLEKDEAAAALAERNIDINGFQGRVSVTCADVTDYKSAGLTQNGVKADLNAFTDRSPAAIFFNPPFFDDPNSLRAPDPTRAAAWINDTTLGDWIALALRRLKEGGTLTVIQRADRLGDMLAAMTPKAGAIRVLPVHPKADAPAKRVIVSAIKTSKTPLKLLPGLVLHDGAGRYTPEADAILRGEAQTALAVD